MRHLVYLLLVANLVYLGWNVFESSSSPSSRQIRDLPPLPATVSRLVTLEEREAKEEQPKEGQSEEVYSQEDLTAEQSADEVSSIEDLAAEQSADEVSSIEDLAAERSADEVSSIEDLAAEQSADEVSSIEDLTTEQPPGAGAAIQCQALGPFLAAKEMQVVESRLLDLGLQPTQRELESEELIGYWVYLPAMPKKDVQAALAILKKHKDKEYYVGKKNFISLGTFKGMSRAERRLKETREMGLDAVLEKRFASRSTWWLDIQSDGRATEQLSSLVSDRPELQLVELACY